MNHHFIKIVALPALALIIAGGCSGLEKVNRQLAPPNQINDLDKDSPYLKAHMFDGSVYILSEWRVSTDGEGVSGEGKLLDANRALLKEDKFTIPIEEVALFETNVPEQSHAVTSIAVISGISVMLTIYCLANPKACFGSCPTFYAWDGKEIRLQAEGFSSSVTRALESKDVDALYRAVPSDRDFEIRMKNEALETHVIRYADLLVAPRREGRRVFFTTTGEFWRVRELSEAVGCIAVEGDCLEKIKSFDGRERTSKTDHKNLATRETIDLEFGEMPQGNLGLVIGARQSLLSTYLFYQTLAYMGCSVGALLAQLERGDKTAFEKVHGIGRILGGIEVLVQGRTGSWTPVGETNETGPLATDVRLIPLPNLGPGPIRIRLRLTQGHWRINYVALALLEEQVEPIRIKPSTVRHGDVVEPSVKELLLDPSKVLISWPGDEYTLVYRLPEDFSGYELFLESRGYYLEWIRKEWLEEENPKLLAMILRNPKKALRRLAPEFKRIEPEIERVFWGSRYAR